MPLVRPYSDEHRAAADRNWRFLLAVACGRFEDALAIAEGPILTADARLTPNWGVRRVLCREVLALVDADPADE